MALRHDDKPLGHCDRGMLIAIELFVIAIGLFVIAVVLFVIAMKIAISLKVQETPLRDHGFTP